MKNILILLLVIFSFLIIPSTHNAQCINVTLSTQAQVNNFACSGSINSLIIDDGGTGDITTLDPIFFSGLTEVSNSLIVRDCPGLTSLLGLDGITTIGGNLSITNTGISSISTDAYPFELVSVGGVIVRNNDNLIESVFSFPDVIFINTVDFSNNDNLLGVAEFYNPGSVTSITVNNNPVLEIFNGYTSTSNGQFITISGNPMLNFIPTFNTLLNVSDIFISGTALSSIDGFLSLNNSGSIQFVNNSALESITGFISLTNINSGSFNAALLFENNDALTEVTGFNNLTNIEDLYGYTSLEIIGNNSLSDCCWVLPLIEASTSNVLISNNASGCNGIGDIGSVPPVLNCIADFTVSTDPGSCSAAVNYTDPLATDDCDDIVQYIASLQLPDGSYLFQDVNAAPGSTFTYDLDPGTSTIFFYAEDGAGNSTICTTSITVVDETPPVWLGGGNSMTINATCGVDDLNSLYTANIPSASDNCGGTNIIETTTLSTICGGSTTNEYVFTVTDDAGNTGVPYTLTINLEDNSGPQFSNVPADMTISCNDNFPNIPNPTASDVCAGDLTNDITVTSSLQIGDCSFGNFAEIHEYTWGVDDGCGNMALVNWTVTVMNDFIIDLGDDVVECGAGSYTINPGNVGTAYEWSTGATSQTLTVTNSGVYGLTVTSNNGCCSIDEIEVTLGSAPDASATGNTIDCSGDPVSIFGNSSSPGVSYSWTGPGGFTSNQQNPTVSEVGTYILTVTNTNNCTATATAEVLSDSNVPDVSAMGGTIDCENPTVILMGSSNTAGVEYNWTGPGGFTSNQQNPEVSLDGVYTLQVVAPNGCFASQSTTVDFDADIPTISISESTADCASQSVLLLANSNTNGLTFFWTGPGGFSSSDFDVFVTETGTYNLEVEASNGCTNSTSIFVEIDFEFSTEISTTPASGAEGGTASIEITGGTEPFNVSWDNGTTGLSTTNLSVGMHTVTIVDGYACSTTEEFEIFMSTSVYNTELNEQVSIYPNPTTGKLWIENKLNASKEMEEILIYDLRGALMFRSSNMQDDWIDMSNFPSGLYLIQINFGEEFLRKKIVKE